MECSNVEEFNVTVVTKNGNIDMGNYFDKGWANVLANRYRNQNQENPLFIECIVTPKTDK